MAQGDHYKALGVDMKATPKEIRKAFHKLAKKCHPDHNPGDKTAEGKFKEINEAYLVLSDPVKKEEYDAIGPGESPRQYRQEDLFRNFDFGGGFDRFGRGVFRDGRHKGEDLVLEHEISFRDAALGAGKLVEFRRNGVHEELTVQIPAGINSGGKIRIPGKGAQGDLGGYPGDLLLIVRIQPDPVFTRDGEDLFVERSIPLSAARLGTSLDVPTMEGGKRIKLPAGIQSGTKIRLKGCGIKMHGSKTKGDLYVKIDVHAPEFFSDADSTDTPDILTQYSVVMVDDEPYILQALKRVFRHEPYKVFCAGSGAEGLRFLAGTSGVAVIVSDQRMPVMNGSGFLALSKVQAPEATRMLLTSYSDIESTVVAMNEGGATRYIRKPWDDSVLLQTVRNSVRQYHLVMENHRQQEIINRQNEELSSWNRNLKDRVLAQTMRIRKQVEELHALTRRQQINFQGMIESLVALTERRDPKSRRHSANTAALSVAMARSMGLTANEIESIRIAALLHDIGKNALSVDAIASDMESLTDEDQIGYLKHPVLGQTALDSVEGLRSIGILIRHHHERYDGRGFPDGLSGDAIPLGAAIISLANCCDREITRHAGGNSVEIVLDELAAQSGTAFARHIIPHLSKPAHEMYDHQFIHNDCELTYYKVDPLQLKEGMLLTKDLYSSSGLFLLEAWTRLDSKKIEDLQRIYSLDPNPDGISVGILHA